MAYERRGNSQHFYYKVRDGDAVRSVHVGRDVAPYFHALGAARDAHAALRRERRRPIERLTAELKRLLGYEASLHAALLYGAGLYRHHGEWRPHVRAELFDEDAGHAPGETGPSEPDSDDPVMAGGPVSPAGAALTAALRGDFDPPDPAHLAASDDLFGCLADVVAFLDRREALPGDLQTLDHARLRPLFDAWVLRARRLQDAFNARSGSAPVVKGDVVQTTAKTDPIPSSNDDRGGLVFGVASAAAALTALDVDTLVESHERHPDTYTPKQWEKMLRAALARHERAQKHLDDVTTRSKAHVRALVDAGDLVARFGCISGDQPRPA